MSGPAIVLVAGATGLVGSEILRFLEDDPTVAEIRPLVRRPVEARSPKVRPVLADLSSPGALRDHPAFDGVTHLYSALGTTIRAAGSQGEFRRVDLYLPRAIAQAARDHGVGHFLLVSALGADARSRVFYNRVKGELEEEVLRMGFRTVTIARPSLLLGDRRPPRPGEELGKRIGWLFPARWRPVEAKSVALALVRAAREDATGVRVIENRDLRERS